MNFVKLSLPCPTFPNRLYFAYMEKAADTLDNVVVKWRWQLSQFHTPSLQSNSKYNSVFASVFYMRQHHLLYRECIAFLGRVVALMTLLRAIVRQPPPAEPKPLVSHCGISYDGFLLMQKLGATPIFFKPKYHQRQQPKITTLPFKKKGHEKTGWAIFFVYSHGTALSLIHSSRKGYWTSFRVTYYSNEILCPLTN